MHLSMAPPNPRKRAAPGSSPAPQIQQQQTYNAPTQLSNADYLRWTQGGAENQNFADTTSAYNMNPVYGSGGGGGGGGNTLSSFDQSLPATHSTQLARRPHNRQLVPTGQRSNYENSGNPWGQFGDDPMLDPQNSNGPLEENDNIELLEEKAAVAKRDAQSKRKQIPPFVQKLSSFLDESKNTDLIRWSDRGDSFVVLDEDEFAKTLIPELFKHNNYASFVRQLNMYGFHKRVGLSDNSMKASERKNKSPSEYYNPYFKRGHPNLLWLINKPKGGIGKKLANKGRVKTEDNDVDSDEDVKEVVDETFGPSRDYNVPSSRAISAAPESSGPLQKREMAVIQSQISEIKNQQGAISQAIARLRKDHNQLYQQAVAFQNLHERHENSITAILTFLATVYNRSLDGQGTENISRMFQNGIPQDPQHPQQGNVVDIGDLGNQQQPVPGSPSPHRKQQRLLMAPPGSRSNPNQQNGHRSGTVEEVFENSPADSTSHMEPQQGIMNLIHNTNAASQPSSNAMQFPDVLSHYENASGNSPLTSEQRSNMLNLMASSSSAPGTNNALVSPSPPQALTPNLADIVYTQAEIDELMRLQNQQSDRISNLHSTLQPLSPSGSIPGISDNSYFTGGAVSEDPSGNHLDLDQYLDLKAWNNTSSPTGGGGNFDFNDLGSTGGADGLGYSGEGGYDLGLDGAGDERENGNGLGGDGNGNGNSRITETRGSSESVAESPIEEIKMEDLPSHQPQVRKGSIGRSPSKRRRKG